MYCTYCTYMAPTHTTGWNSCFQNQQTENCLSSPSTGNNARIWLIIQNKFKSYSATGRTGWNSVLAAFYSNLETKTQSTSLCWRKYWPHTSFVLSFVRSFYFDDRGKATDGMQTLTWHDCIAPIQQKNRTYDRIINIMYYNAYCTYINHNTGIHHEYIFFFILQYE